MKARVKATGEIVEISEDCSYLYAEHYDKSYNLNELEFLDVKEKSFPKDEDYWTRLEHQYAGMAMQGFCANYNDFTKVNDGTCTNVEMICENARIIAHALVKKVRYEENPKELEGLKKELEALKIEKTILENKIKLLTEERK